MRKSPSFRTHNVAARNEILSRPGGILKNAVLAYIASDRDAKANRLLIPVLSYEDAIRRDEPMILATDALDMLGWPYVRGNSNGRRALHALGLPVYRSNLGASYLYTNKDKVQGLVDAMAAESWPDIATAGQGSPADGTDTAADIAGAATAACAAMIAKVQEQSFVLAQAQTELLRSIDARLARIEAAWCSAEVSHG